MSKMATIMTALASVVILGACEERHTANTSEGGADAHPFVADSRRATIAAAVPATYQEAKAQALEEGRRREQDIDREIQHGISSAFQRHLSDKREVGRRLATDGRLTVVFDFASDPTIGRVEANSTYRQFRDALTRESILIDSIVTEGNLGDPLKRYSTATLKLKEIRSP